MRNRKFSNYLYWGITAFLVISACILLVFVMIHMDRVRAGMGFLAEILMPVIYGAVLAYLLTPIYNRVSRGTEHILKRHIKSEKRARMAGKGAATAVSLAVLFAVVSGLLAIMIPQLVTSIRGIINSLPSNLYNLEMWLLSFLDDNPQLAADATEILNNTGLQLQTWVNQNIVPNLATWNENILPNLWDVVSTVSNSVMDLMTVLKNVFIGVIVTAYMLNIKDSFCTHGKKAVYGIFPLEWANRIIAEARYIHRVFGGFIIGKLLDSLIIGIICFCGMSLMKLPYVMLVSVIVGVTNVIPFFGPFIGAIPSAFFILLVSPVQCLYFVGFVFLLQQFDGNILGPKILGDSTGISSFGVLFSILLFGGLFGFVGMVIGVPTFAVLYNLAKEVIEHFLRKKELSCNTGDYDGLDYIENDQKTYIRKQED